MNQSDRTARFFILGASVSLLLGCSAADPVGANDQGQATGGTAASNGTDGFGAGSTQGPQWCNVAPIFQSKCQTCHGEQLVAGAPMPLTSWEDTQGTSRSGDPLIQTIKGRINGTIPGVSQMPPPPTSLDSSELDLLNQWIDNGAPNGACGSPGGTTSGGGNFPGTTGGNTGVSNGSGTTGTSGGSSTGTSSGTGTGNTTGSNTGVVNGGTSSSGGSTGTSNSPPPPPPPTDCTNYELRARADGTNDPYHVLTKTEEYHCFNITVPWTEPVQGFQFEPIIDNSKVLHHWLLYSLDSPAQDGTSFECLGTHPNAQLVAGWAPGAEGFTPPTNVGFELPPPGSTMLLEIHYFNQDSSPTEFDQSGARLCASAEFRENTATVSWLGTEAIILPPQAQTDVVSNCTPTSQETIQILRSWPHMHTYGTAFKSVINRAGGAQEELLTVPNYDFYYQLPYDTPATLNPGDTITTTCTFQNTSAQTVTFGESTYQEMCYNFVWAYPARALTGAGFLHRNQCFL